MRFSTEVKTILGALRWPSASSTPAFCAEFLKTLAKLVSLSDSHPDVALLTLSRLWRVFCRELGLSDPMAPQEPVVD